MQPPNQTIHVDTGGGDYAEQNIYKTVVMPGDALPPIDLEAAGALLASIPIDRVPDVADLPLGSLMILSPNPLFTGREAALRQLAAALTHDDASVVVVGMGGMGKTTVASEFVHRYGRYFAGGAFWLSFADPDGIENEIARCGGTRGMRLPAFSELAFTDQVQRVLAEWQSPVPRLLIFDNCEDTALVRRYRPQTGGCRVLITSRNPSWSRRLNVQVVALDILPRHESIALLRVFQPDLRDDEAHAIAEALGDLPLALYLAGSFLEYTPDTSTASYLKALTGPDVLNHPSLQGYAVRDEDSTGRLHVGRAFALSFDRLEAHNEVDQVALTLLARAACLAPGEPFPRSLLLDSIHIEPGDESAALRATDALRRLVGLGLLEQGGDDTLKLHRLLCRFVQHAIPDASAEDDVILALSNAADRMNETALPGLMQPLLAHLAYLAGATATRTDNLVATLLNNYATGLNASANYAAALPLYERALAIREATLGADHPETATILNNLAGLYVSMGNYAAALPLYERALAVSEATHGAQHPDTAQSLNNLAVLYDTIGDDAAALPLYERALTIREATLGAQHPATATTLNNLAILHERVGNYQAALPLLERALAIREASLGAEHPDTAASLNSLAIVRQATGNNEAVLPLLERALAIREATLGAEHPDTAASLNSLALLHQAAGNHAAALPLFERALAIFTSALGAEHPETATILNNLAVLHDGSGNAATALPLYQQALAIREAALGAEHIDTAQSLNNLAGLYESIGNFEAALPLYERALAIREAVLGAEHPATHTVRESIERVRLPGLIAHAAGLDTTQRSQVERLLDTWQQQGYMLRDRARRIWSGEREPETLVSGLEQPDAGIIRETLRLLARAEDTSGSEGSGT